MVVIDNQRFALTTDLACCFPIIFPGGDIGRLAICGTVNDLVMVGATPIALTCGLVLEEGLSFDVLQRVVASRRQPQRSGNSYRGRRYEVVQKAVRINYLSILGLEKINDGINISANAKDGDVIIVSGTIGDHGIVVLSARENWDLRPLLKVMLPR